MRFFFGSEEESPAKGDFASVFGGDADQKDVDEAKKDEKRLIKRFLFHDEGEAEDRMQETIGKGGEGEVAMGQNRRGLWDIVSRKKACNDGGDRHNGRNDDDPVTGRISLEFPDPS